MKELLSPEIKQKLIANWKDGLFTNKDYDHYPVVRLFDPIGQSSWLISEMNPEDEDTLFGLCDLGYPELGYVSYKEIKSYVGPLGIGIEVDKHFKPDKTITEYADEARAKRLGL